MAICSYLQTLPSEQPLAVSIEFLEADSLTSKSVVCQDPEGRAEQGTAPLRSKETGGLGEGSLGNQVQCFKLYF